eukprot:TCALIF_11929-PA protein Name:"Protein of unknown function" AED:0.15 eAED:0.15 QI:135/1/0.5/1/0/0.5/2/0/161
MSETADLPAKDSEGSFLDQIPSKTPNHEKEDEQQLSLAFFLTIHTLMVIAAYVMLLGNLYPTTSLTFVSILIVFTHLSVVEMLLRGLKKQVFSQIAPWFCLSLLDEIVIIGMGSSHLSHSLEEVDGSFGQFMREKGALFVIGLVLFGEVLVIQFIILSYII